MNIIAAIFTIREDVKLEDLTEVLKHERATIEEWKKAGLLHDLYLRQAKNGAVLMFQEMSEEQAKDLVMTLPLFPYLNPVEYLRLLKQ
jgi:muconolactone delta-isomerase